MANGYFNINGDWKSVFKWYINTPPSAPVATFDGSDDPFDRDEVIKTHIQTNLNTDSFDYTNPPQASSILLPSFTLGDKFDLEFRYKADSTDSDNELACIFTNQHDRQGVFSDHVFAIYPLPASQGQPSDTLAIHFVPLNDPNGHQKLILTDATTVSQQTVFGGTRLLFGGLYDGDWHTFRFSYDNGNLSATMDNDDGNFVSVSFYTDMNNTASLKTSVDHGDGYGSSSQGRLMASYFYWIAKINADGFDSTNGSTPRFNAHSGSLDFFKLTTYPSGSAVNTIDYPLKDGVSAGSYQPILDVSGRNNYGQLVYASNIDLNDLWDYSAGATNAWREIEEAWYNDSGIWKKFWSNKITLHITETTADFDMFTEAGSPTVPVEVDVFVDSGVNVYSTTINHGAIYGSSNFPSGSVLKITNNGSVWGKGGDGGNSPFACGLLEARGADGNNNEYGSVLKTQDVGGSNSDVEDGQAGGDAITLCGDTTIINNGKIFGGGGGGGGVRIYNYAHEYTIYDEGHGVYRGGGWHDASIGGGGGAGYIGGTGGTITKGSASLNWANPPSAVNNSGQKWGAGDLTAIKARDGGRTRGARGLVGCQNVSYLYETSYTCKGGDLGKAGNMKFDSQKKYSGRGYDYRLTSNSGGAGLSINRNNHSLTTEGLLGVNNIKGEISNSSNPPTRSVSPVVTNLADPVPKKRDKIFGTCVLGTSCFHHRLISEDDLMAMCRWRMKTQKNEWLSDERWLGYMIGFKPLAEKMMDNQKLARFVYWLIVRDWVRKSKGECNMSIRIFLMSVYSLSVYYLKKKECEELRKKIPTTAKGVLKFYKKIIKSI